MTHSCTQWNVDNFLPTLYKLCFLMKCCEILFSGKCFRNLVTIPAATAKCVALPVYTKEQGITFISLWPWPAFSGWFEANLCVSFSDCGWHKCGMYWSDNFSPRMPCQWYVRGGGEGKRRILIGQSVPPTPFGMAFGRLKLSPLYCIAGISWVIEDVHAMWLTCYDSCRFCHWVGHGVVMTGACRYYGFCCSWPAISVVTCHSNCLAVILYPEVTSLE
jgi:hypothetical protein